MKKAIFTVAFLAFALTMGPSAYAGQSAGVSGSATDQYVEMIPDPGGDRVPGPVDTPDPSGSAPSRPGVEKLVESGPNGESAAALALATAAVVTDTQVTGGGGSGTSGDGSQRAPSSPAPSSPAPLDLDSETSGVGSFISGVAGSGPGFIFPLMLILTLVGVAWVRLAAKHQNEA